jgi:predicted nucleic acid-binding protein
MPPARQGASPKLAEVIEQFLALVRVLPWDSAAAQAHARLRAWTEAEGAALGALDTLIAPAAACEQLAVTGSTAAVVAVPLGRD